MSVPCQQSRKNWPCQLHAFARRNLPIDGTIVTQCPSQEESHRLTKKRILRHRFNSTFRLESFERQRLLPHVGRGDTNPLNGLSDLNKKLFEIDWYRINQHIHQATSNAKGAVDPASRRKPRTTPFRRGWLGGPAWTTVRSFRFCLSVG